MAENGDKHETPPYTSFTSFRNFIKGLAETGVPSRIDRTLMSNLSGTQQAAIMATLKWLELVDSNNIPSDTLTALVHADDENFSKILREILEHSYDFMTDGSIDLSKATTGQLEERFRQYGITGSTITKCVAFYLAAAKEAGMQISPYVKPPQTRNYTGGKKRTKSQKKTQRPSENPQPNKPPKGMISIPVPLPNLQDGEIRLPANMTAAQWQTAKKMAVFILETYTENPAENGEEVQ